jgi:hypothetical protein
MPVALTARSVAMSFGDTCRGDSMIELVPAEHDDLAFLSLAQRIVNGAIAALEIPDAFVVHVDSWFDYKWLRWWSRKDEELRVPTFTPNRVRSQKRFVWDVDKSAWTFVALARPLHIRQPGRPWLAQPLYRFSRNAAFIWYSGSTAMNKVGSLMFYRSGAAGYAWYASLRNDAQWVIADEFQITRRELLSFEERGHQLEITQA